MLRSEERFSVAGSHLQNVQTSRRPVEVARRVPEINGGSDSHLLNVNHGRQNSPLPLREAASAILQHSGVQREV
jgi:hypothetical protein